LVSGIAAAATAVAAAKANCQVKAARRVAQCTGCLDVALADSSEFLPLAGYSLNRALEDDGDDGWTRERSRVILLNLNSSRSVIAISKLCRALSRATVCQKSAQTDDH